MPDRKLLLFDIDGTILLTHGVGRRAVDMSLSEVFGRAISSEGVSFSGKTDPQILREVLDLNGIKPDRLNGEFEAAVEVYAGALERLMPEAVVEVLPGVPALIKTLAERDDVQLALLTGNLEPMAYLKLRYVELDQYFPFGAFGSDHEDRYQLPPIAVERARKHTATDFGRGAVIIIGDTEHDIGCGRGISARSVAVCTGRFTRQDLLAHNPDVLLDDLSCSETFLREVVGVE